MRLRLLPWIWERIECVDVVSQEDIPRKLDAVMKALSADASLATSVRYLFDIPLLWVGTDPRPLKVPDDIRDMV